MNRIELKLGKAQAKYFKWHHDSIDGKSEVSPLFRELILLMLEPKYDTQLKRYRSDTYNQNLTETIIIEVAERIDQDGVRNLQVMYIPPYKMNWINNMLKKFIQMEINVSINAYLSAGKELRQGVFAIYDLYDIDESELNYDSVLKSNQRYRNKFGLIYNESIKPRNKKSAKCPSNSKQ